MINEGNTFTKIDEIRNFSNHRLKINQAGLVKVPEYMFLVFQQKDRKRNKSEAACEGVLQAAFTRQSNPVGVFRCV